MEPDATGEPSWLDLVRDSAEGRLDAARAADLRRQLELDPELAALAEEYLAVHALTVDADDVPPACGLVFEDLERRLEPGPAPLRWRRVAAAAVLLIALGLAASLALRAWSPRADRPVLLTAIDLTTEPGALGAPATLPAGLSEFDPSDVDGVHWLRDLDQAVEFARVVERPLLVYGTHPMCPIAARIDREVFSETSVQSAVRSCVPIRINLGALPEDEAVRLMRNGSPFLEVWDAEGRSLCTVRSDPTPASVVDGIERSLESQHEPPSLDWQRVRFLAREFEQGYAAEQRSEYEQALARYDELARAEFFAEYGRAGCARLGEVARSRLLSARQAAAADPDSAAALLRDAARRFAGTRFGVDFEAVLERLERDGRFPEVASTAAS